MDTLLGQKRLERIILLNSSSFRSAEVQVDGNTHISGDNSSGKSTFLQIATLFYTGDSSSKALGIGDGKKPFVEYNLSKSNSYINAAFDMACEEIRKLGRKDTKYQRRQMFNKDSRETFGSTNSAEAARKRMIARNQKKNK